MPLLFRDDIENGHKGYARKDYENKGRCIMNRKVLVMVAAAVLLVSVSAYASETDARIESSARQSYVFKKYLKDDAIEVKSDKGVVTLRGTVSEESHKSLAQETVASLPGVKNVDNLLELKGERPAEESDGWIGTQVKWSLIYNRHVNGFGTQVLVTEGVVTLRGEADSQAQKDLSGEYAKDIKGVKSVNNEMTIAKAPRKEGKTVGETIDDASITAQVKVAFLTHHSTSAFKTGIAVSNGVVTLTGDATSAAGKDMAGKVAGDVGGVKKVINNMIIKEPSDKQ
jgi:osmotically-inducible protein OsmY